MKKLKLISILSVILIAMFSVCTASYAQTYNDTEEVRSLLKKIGVITAEDYNPDSEITRIEYLKWIVRAIKSDESFYADNAEQIFYDVAADDDDAPLVNLCYDLGIITGRADGRLCPNDNVTIEEASIMAIRAAGANDLIKTLGSWTQAAITLDLLNKVSSQEGGTVTGVAAERIIFNMLNAGLVQSDDGKTWYVDTETSVLEMKHGIERATGIVDSNSYASLYGGRAAQVGQVSIDGQLYEIEPELDGLFLGENVAYYYEKDRYSGDIKKIVYMCSARNEILDMDIESAQTLSGLSFKYFDENDKNEEAILSSDALTLENGVKTTIPVGGYTLPKYGSIRLIDNNNDSEFDVVIVTNTEIRVINMFANDVLYLSTTPIRSIKFEEYSRVVIKNKAGEILNTDALVAGSLVEITASSDKSCVEIVVLNDVVTLTIKGMEQRDSNGYPVWYLTDDAGNTYRTAREFESIHPENELIMGAEHTVLLNSNGHIAALAGEIVGDVAQYGYLMKIYDTPPEGEGNIFVRILTSSGEIVNYPTKTKVTFIDDAAKEKTITNKQLLTSCESRQVVRYTLNAEGKLSQIEEACNDSSSEGFKKGLTAPEKGDSSVGTYYSRYYSSNSLIGPNIPVGPDTLVFKIPLEGDSDYEECKDDYTKYSVSKKAGLKNQGYFYGLQSYMYGDDFYAKVVVTSSSIANASNAVDKSDPKMLVTNVNTVYSEAEDAPQQVLVGYVDGSQTSYVISDTSLLEWTVSGETEVRTISEGDVIKMNVDSDGKITNVAVAFDYDRNELFTADGQSAENKDYNTGMVHIYGQISKKYENAFFSVLRLNNDNTSTTYTTESSAYIYPVTKNVTYIYEYDSSKKRDQRVRVITLPEVMSLEDDPEIEDKVVMVTKDSSVPFVTIYK